MEGTSGGRGRVAEGTSGGGDEWRRGEGLRGRGVERTRG